MHVWLSSSPVTKILLHAVPRTIGHKNNHKQFDVDLIVITALSLYVPAYISFKSADFNHHSDA